METAGEVIRREVAQRGVCFTDHTLSGPAPTEEDARQLLVWNLFDSLVERLAERLAARQRTREELQKVKDYLGAQLRSADAGRRPALQQRLDALLADLAKAHAALDLRRLAGDFDEILLSPEHYLSLEHVTLRLDGMGVLRADDTGANTHALDFTDLIGRDRRRWTVVMVRCHPRPELLAMADRLREAGRWLAI